MSEPIACSLSGPDLQKRLEEIAAAGKRARRLGDELRFPADATTRERLEAIIAAERHCCPFLVFELMETGDELALSIAASSDEAEPIAAELRDAFRAADSADNMELSVRAAEAFNARDLDGFLGLMDVDVEGHPLAMDMEGGYCGHSGTTRWWNAQFDSFPDLTIEILDMSERDDLTIAELCMRGHGAGGAVPVRTTIWRVSQWRGGKCIWWGTFRSAEEAIETKGLAA
jgi:SnoaL-like domain